MRVVLRSRAALVGALVLLATIFVLARSLPFREVIIVILVLTAPGLAVTMLAGINDLVVIMLLAVPLSLSLNALVATVLLYLGLWSSDLIFVTVMGITLLAAGLRAHERPARAALLGVALLPGLVLVAAELSNGAP